MWKLVLLLLAILPCTMAAANKVCGSNAVYDDFYQYACVCNFGYRVDDGGSDNDRPINRYPRYIHGQGYVEECSVAIVICPSDSYVQGNLCVECPAGTGSPGGYDASAGDFDECAALKCVDFDIESSWHAIVSQCTPDAIGGLGPGETCESLCKSADGQSSGDVCELDCNSGYKLASGTSKLTVTCCSAPSFCNQESSFSGGDLNGGLNCEAVNCPSGAVQSDHVEDGLKCTCTGLAEDDPSNPLVFNTNTDVWDGACPPVVECKPYDFPTGVTSSACSSGGSLTNNTDCMLQCDTGFVGSDALLSCAADASAGQAATTTISCIKVPCIVSEWSAWSLVPDQVSETPSTRTLGVSRVRRLLNNATGSVLDCNGVVFKETNQTVVSKPAPPLPISVSRPGTLFLQSDQTPALIFGDESLQNSVSIMKEAGSSTLHVLGSIGADTIETPALHINGIDVIDQIRILAQHVVQLEQTIQHLEFQTHQQ